MHSSGMCSACSSSRLGGSPPDIPQEQTSLAAGIPWSRHPPGTGTPEDQTPPVECMLGDTVNKRVVRILLECILVLILFLLQRGGKENTVGENSRFLSHKLEHGHLLCEHSSERAINPAYFSRKPSSLFYFVKFLEEKRSLPKQPR